MSATSSAAGSLKVLVYSSNSLTRDAVKLALGRRPAPELPQLEYLECATTDGPHRATARCLVGHLVSGRRRGVTSAGQSGTR